MDEDDVDSGFCLIYDDVCNSITKEILSRIIMCSTITYLKCINCYCFSYQRNYTGRGDTLTSYFPESILYVSTMSPLNLLYLSVGRSRILNLSS